MANNDKNNGGAKSFLRSFGLACTIIGLIAAAAGIAVLMLDADIENKIKYGIAIGGIALAFVGVIFVLAGLKKTKAEAKAKPVECMYCGEVNPPFSKYCRKCGKELVKKCVNCGAVLDLDAKYCNTCGVRVRKDS